MIRLRVRDSFTVFAAVLNRLEPFTTYGALYGRLTLDHTGQLDWPTVQQLRAYRDADRLLYVVYSYATPIAWCIQLDNPNPAGEWREWLFNDVKYSKTTTKHQGKLRAALNM